MSRIDRSAHSVQESMKPIPQRREADKELLSLARKWYWQDAAFFTALGACLATIVVLMLTL